MSLGKNSLSQGSTVQLITWQPPWVGNILSHLHIPLHTNTQQLSEKTVCSCALHNDVSEEHLYNIPVETPLRSGDTSTDNDCKRAISFKCGCAARHVSGLSLYWPNEMSSKQKWPVLRLEVHMTFKLNRTPCHIICPRKSLLAACLASDMTQCRRQPQLNGLCETTLKVTGTCTPAGLYLSK